MGVSRCTGDRINYKDEFFDDKLSTYYQREESQDICERVTLYVERHGSKFS